MRRAVALVALLALGTACTGSTADEPAIPPIATPAYTTTTTSGKFPAGSERAFKDGVLAEDPSVDSSTLDCMWQWVEDNLTPYDVIAMTNGEEIDVPAEMTWSLMEACPSLWQYAR